MLVPNVVEESARLRAVALRDTLKSYLNTRGFRCLSTHGSAEEALRELPAVEPAVVLMDINLPRKSGIDCVSELKTLIPSSKCIILTAFEDADLIFRALAAGALGVVHGLNVPAFGQHRARVDVVEA